MPATKPFQGDVFQNSTFQTMESLYVYPNDLVWLGFTIDGVDMSDYLDLEKAPPQIESVLTKQYDRCTIQLFNVPNTLAITNYQDVIIYDSDSKIFAGVIISVAPKESSLTYDLDYVITCVDYSKLLETKIVRAVKYTAKTDAYILNDIFTTYLPEIDATTYVSALATLANVPINRKSVKNTLDFICGLSGADWYVDYDKHLHYFKSEDTSAAFSFSDTPDLAATMPYSGLQKTDDGTGIFNVVEIVGGNYKSGDETVYLPGTGLNTRIMLPFKYSAPTGQTSIQVWRNDGSQAVPVWTPLTVKVGYLDELAGANEVLYYYQESVLELQSAWPAFTNALKLTGQYEIPLRTQVRDQASIDLYGREIEYPYFDNTIIDKTVAQLKGKQLLIESSLGKQTYTWSAEKRGLRAGMTVGMKNDAMLIDTSFLIQKVNMSIGIGGAIQTKVSAGKYNASLVDILIALKRASSASVEYRDDEVLDVLLSVSEEAEIADETITVYRHAGTYNKWDDGSHWGFAKWG